MSSSNRSAIAEELVAISRSLGYRAARLKFGKKVAYVYNPVVYARGAHEQYLRRYGGQTGVVLLVGMNPGP